MQKFFLLRKLAVALTAPVCDEAECRGPSPMWSGQNEAAGDRLG